MKRSICAILFSPLVSLFLPLVLLLLALVLFFLAPEANAMSSASLPPPVSTAQAQTAVPFGVYSYVSPYGYARAWCGTLAGTLNANGGNLSWSANTSSLIDTGQGCTNPITAYPGDALFYAEVQFLDIHVPFNPFDDEWVPMCSSSSSSPGFVQVSTQYTSGSCTTSARGTFRYRLVSWWRSLNDNYGWKGVQAYSGEVWNP